MARKMSEKNKKQKTQQSLENALKKNKLSEKYISDKVEEYMSFYDDLNYINNRLIELKDNEKSSLKTYTDAVAEKRRISSEMRSILSFLGLKPSDILPPGGEGDEEL